MNDYRGHDHEAGTVVYAQDGDVVEVSDSLSEFLLKHFPDNFSKPGRKAKEEPKPEAPASDVAGLDAAEDKEINPKSRRVKRK